MHPNLCFLLECCAGTSPITRTSTKVLSPIGACLKQRTLGLFRLKPRGPGASSQVPAASTLHRQDQGRCAYYYPTHRGVRLLPGSWYVVLGPIAPTQALWSLDAKLLLLRGDTMRDMLFCHVADIILEIYLTHTDSSLFEKCTLFPVLCCQLSPLNHYHPQAFQTSFHSH